MYSPNFICHTNYKLSSSNLFYPLNIIFLLVPLKVSFKYDSTIILSQHLSKLLKFKYYVIKVIKYFDILIISLFLGSLHLLYCKNNRYKDFCLQILNNSHWDVILWYHINVWTIIVPIKIPWLEINFRLFLDNLAYQGILHRYKYNYVILIILLRLIFQLHVVLQCI